ncbi:auxin-responsive protein SAUR32-like [Argentina anserina]|uniref:auxin-responsive protein SAUR32-like n=1 Tax=Argentina anserina TaxID=57926 RepID=UPI00217653D8|nr:auxin-responsive protein SAUR32-like [Potentilla anserina]
MKGKGKQGLITKTWERCKSIGRKSTSSAAVPALTKKSMSCPNIVLSTTDDDARLRHRRQVAPEGCFSVYVGPEKQRFVVKTEYANHPLFKLLLEEAESEFGYHSKGPLVLPCGVQVFYKVLLEMEDCGGADEKAPRGCGFAKRHGSYHLLSPSRLVVFNQF